MPNNQERWTTEQYRAYVNKDIQPVKTHKVVSGSSTPEVKKGKNVNRQLTQAEKSEKWAAIDWPGPSIFRMPMYEGRNKTDRMHYMQRHKVKKAYAEAAQASLRGYGLEPDKYIKGVVKITLRFFFNDRHWRDKDNWAPKFLLDALQGYILFDDSPKYVQWDIVDFEKRLITKKEPYVEMKVEVVSA